MMEPCWQNFKNEGFDYIGFEPSMSVAKKAKENNIIL